MNKKINKLNISALGFYLELKYQYISFFDKILIYSGGIIFTILLQIILIKFNNNLYGMNLFILIINLLPIYPLDGFNIFYTILSRFYEDEFLIDVFLLIGTLIILFVSLLFIIYRLPIILIIDLFLIINIGKLYKKKKISYLKNLTTLFYKAN